MPISPVDLLLDFVPSLFFVNNHNTCPAKTIEVQFALTSTR